MVRTVIVAMLLAPTLAAAAPSAEPGTLGGSLLTVEPDSEPNNGELGGWLAYAPGSYYVGGEIAIGNATAGREDGAVSYHAVVGGRTRISPHFSVMVDGGLGVSQQFDIQLGILGGESDTDTRAFAPSTAARLHLVGELGHVGGSEIGIALTGDARSTLDENAAPALGLGLGVYLAK